MQLITRAYSKVCLDEHDHRRNGNMTQFEQGIAQWSVNGVIKLGFSSQLLHFDPKRHVVNSFAPLTNHPGTTLKLSISPPELPILPLQTSPHQEETHLNLAQKVMFRLAEKENLQAHLNST